MSEGEFNEVSGRIEGLARAFLMLGATLQRQGVLDEQLLQAQLRRHADALPPSLGVARTTLTELSDQLLRDYFLQHGKTEADWRAALQGDSE